MTGRAFGVHACAHDADPCHHSCRKAVSFFPCLLQVSLPATPCCGESALPYTNRAKSYKNPDREHLRTFTEQTCHFSASSNRCSILLLVKVTSAHTYADTAPPLPQLQHLDSKMASPNASTFHAESARQSHRFSLASSAWVARQQPPKTVM